MARVIAAVSAVVACYHLVDLFTAWLRQRAAKTDTKLDDQLVPLIRRAVKLFIVAMGTIFVLQNLNVDVAGLLAGMGLGGLAFALAAKDTVANLFGSATIFASRPFQIGDWVYIDGTEGTVESVGFRSTRVRTFYNSLISVPNAKVADSVVDNYGARQYRRVKAMLGLTYDTPPDKLEAFVVGVRELIANHPKTRKDLFEVHFYEFGASSLNVLVYFFFQVANWSEELRQRQVLFLEFLKLAQKIGGELRLSYPDPPCGEHAAMAHFHGKRARTIHSLRTRGLCEADSALWSSLRSFSKSGILVEVHAAHRDVPISTGHRDRSAHESAK